jgi:hypothetical protein
MHQPSNIPLPDRGIQGRDKPELPYAANMGAREADIWQRMDVAALAFAALS